MSRRLSQADDLRLALALAEAADDIGLRYHGGSYRAAYKEDGSIVTTADVQVERALLRMLRRERPRDSVLSEESGGAVDKAGRRWLIDPIDGTAHFHRGGHNWGVHVALEVEGELSVAVMTRPCRKLRWWAARGEGAFRAVAGRPLIESRPLQLTEPAGGTDLRVSGLVEPGSTGALRLAAYARWIDDDGEDSVIAALLEGELHAVLDEGGHIWDRAPAALLVHEAGGAVLDPDGGSRLDREWVLYSTPGTSGALMHLLRVAEHHPFSQTAEHGRDLGRP